MTWPTDYLNKVICGDCLEVMKGIPDKSVDLVLTDPPYGISFNNNSDLAHRRGFAFGGKKESERPNGISNDGPEALEIFDKFLIEANRIMKKGACCCCCCCGGGPKPLFAEWALLMDRIIGFNHAAIWDKMGLGMGIHFRRTYEFILIAQKGSPAHRWNGGNDTSNVIRIPKIIPDDTEHPTAKPVDLMKFFVHLFSNPGDVILDPFFGHGTTGVAAKLLGRQFIGIEISEKYCEIARKRIDGTLVNRKLNFQEARL
jgi:site-specific DNA-methyltransferase (adenine-specific)